jgi:phospholipid/cholesterol/gamma-HCH transport system substrate-binding protein
MEQKNKRSFIVGVFVFLALVIFVLGVMTLGGQKSLFNNGATINAVFDEVNGLQAGSNVWYAGVKVGTVQTIAFNKEGRVNVEMNIEKKALSIVRGDTKAKVGADGFIGSKIVILYGGNPTTPPVEDGSTLTVERSLGTEEIMATFQENNKNLVAITANFKTISDKIVNGQGSIGKLLNDDQMVNDLQGAIISIKGAAVNAQQLAANVYDYTAKLNTKGSLANDLVTDTVIFSRLKATVNKIDALSATANAVVLNLSEVSEKINVGMTDRSTPVGLLLNDKETAADIKTTIKNLQASTQKLDENMEALQNNFLLRGFFKKKNKEK